MTAIRSGEPLSTEQLIERQMLLWTALQKAAHERPASSISPTLRFMTLSRDVGSRGDEIAHELGEALDWHVYDREIVDFIARDSHARESLVQQLDEKSRGLLDDTVRRLLEMAGDQTLAAEDYHAALLRSLVFLAQRGNAILIGRGANYALRGEPGLHVRIVASSEVRVQRLSERWGATPRDAAQRMHKLDDERRAFIRRYFRQQMDDPRCYDLVFNTDSLSTAQVVSSILAALRARP